MELLRKQEYAVYYLKDNVTEELLYGGAAGGGKSALGCLWLIENCQMYAGSRWMMGRSKLKTLKETTLKTFFEQINKLGISKDFHYNQNDGLITYKPNGSEIILKDLFLYPSDPDFDSLGSLEICGAFIDECNQVTFKAWQVVKSRCRFKLAEFGIIPKMLGTCNPAKTWVYSNFYLKNKSKTLEPYRKFIQALPTDNPHLHNSYLKSLLQLDKNSRERLYFGNWEYDDDPTALMSIDRINEIFTLNRNLVRGGDSYITCDVARFGVDKTVIMVWDGLRVVKIVTYELSSTVQVAGELMRLEQLYGVDRSNVVIDEDGVGGGVVDMMEGCTGFINNSRALYGENFNNLKSQCSFKLADIVNANRLFVDCDIPEIVAAIIEELEQIKQQNMDKDTTKQVISKDKVKAILGKSPDYSDCLLMRMIKEIDNVLDLETEAV